MDVSHDGGQFGRFLVAGPASLEVVRPAAGEVAATTADAAALVVSAFSAGAFSSQASSQGRRDAEQPIEIRVRMVAPLAASRRGGDTTPLWRLDFKGPTQGTSGTGSRWKNTPGRCSRHLAGPIVIDVACQRPCSAASASLADCPAPTSSDVDRIQRLAHRTSDHRGTRGLFRVSFKAQMSCRDEDRWLARRILSVDVDSTGPTGELQRPGT
jgi:hypothetical protein